MAFAGDSGLGKATEYHFDYDPSRLFAIKRSDSREGVNIAKTMQGFDRWTAFELSWLNAKGRPEIAIAEFDFPSTSENLVESKSFKLYLNGFNQSTFANAGAVVTALEKDLSLLVKADVVVRFYTLAEFQSKITAANGLPFLNLDAQDISCKHYQTDASLLKPAPKKSHEYFSSGLFRSLCPVTGQPDWASVYLYVSDVKQSVCPESLLAYLLSYRNHQGFHEQCVEMIFSDLLALLPSASVVVYARFMRRGGLDINPFRSNGLNFDQFSNIYDPRQ